jgi:hypothetical protein
MDMSELLDRNPTPQSETTTVCVVGQKGTGKTYCMAILGEHLECRALYFDTVGAFTKKQLVRDAIYLKVSTLDKQKILTAIAECYKRKDKETGQQCKRVVLDMGGLIPREKVYLVDMVCPWIMSVGNMAVFCDEMSLICPQSSRVYSEEFLRLVIAGRNENIVPVVFATQRTQAADKNVLALADKYFIFRLIHNLDRNKVKDLIGLDAQEWLELESKIMTLQTQEAYLFYTQDGQRVLKRMEMPDYEP